MLDAGQFPDISGLPFSLLRGAASDEILRFSWGWLDTTHRAIGLDWQCMVLDRHAFLETGGLREDMGKWTMSDYCLRLEQKEYFTIISPWVNFNSELVDGETGAHEDQCFLEEWGEVVKNHPLRNRNLKKGYNNDWTLVF